MQYILDDEPVDLLERLEVFLVEQLVSMRLSILDGYKLFCHILTSVIDGDETERVVRLLHMTKSCHIDL